MENYFFCNANAGTRFVVGKTYSINKDLNITNNRCPWIDMPYTIMSFAHLVQK